jgi:hypothetical protein
VSSRHSYSTLLQYTHTVHSYSTLIQYTHTVHSYSTLIHSYSTLIQYTHTVLTTTLYSHTVLTTTLYSHTVLTTTLYSHTVLTTTLYLCTLPMRSLYSCAALMRSLYWLKALGQRPWSCRLLMDPKGQMEHGGWVFAFTAIFTLQSRLRTFTPPLFIPLPLIYTHCTPSIHPLYLYPLHTHYLPTICLLFYTHNYIPTIHPLYTDYIHYTPTIHPPHTHHTPYTTHPPHTHCLLVSGRTPFSGWTAGATSIYSRTSTPPSHTPKGATRYPGMRSQRTESTGHLVRRSPTRIGFCGRRGVWNFLRPSNGRNCCSQTRVTLTGTQWDAD